MTPEQIIDLIEPLKSLGAEVRLKVIGGRVHFYDSFMIDAETQESHDVAWDLGCSWQERLKEVGLRLGDGNSDNDSIFGFVEPLEQPHCEHIDPELSIQKPGPTPVVMVSREVAEKFLGKNIPQ